MLNKFEENIGYKFKNQDLLKEALTHGSYSYEQKAAKSVVIRNNQRLEFLGDAVLEISVSHFLYKRFTDMPEGELTKFRANLVCEPALAERARKLNIGEFLLMSRGEDSSRGRERDSILADAFESVIGAIYLDGGFLESLDFVIKQMEGDIEETLKTFRTSDNKTHLQEVIQAFSKEALVYEIIDTKGPDHDKTFHATVSHEGKFLGEGIGKSKKEAEQVAACNALEFLKKQGVIQ
ncbi:MAG: ribonuclease III [Defluviitaleaceae bacterium]|nr:ribonuclease III [Defluviitaleaceae bacterium]